MNCVCMYWRSLSTPSIRKSIDIFEAEKVSTYCARRRLWYFLGKLLYPEFVWGIHTDVVHLFVLLVDSSAAWSPQQKYRFVCKFRLDQDVQRATVSEQLVDSVDTLQDSTPYYICKRSVEQGTSYLGRAGGVSSTATPRVALAVIVIVLSVLFNKVEPSKGPRILEEHLYLRFGKLVSEERKKRI
jgi:hypothetical protein